MCIKIIIIYTLAIGYSGPDINSVIHSVLCVCVCLMFSLVDSNLSVIIIVLGTSGTPGLPGNVGPGGRKGIVGDPGPRGGIGFDGIPGQRVNISL